MQNNYFSICLITKDSNYYIKEWLDYHINLGVEHFFIYDDYSKVPLKEILTPYIDKGLVTYEPITFKKPQQQQLIIYMKCLRDHCKDSFWIAFIDDDEFLIPKDKPLLEFMKEFESYGGLVVNTVLFGSSGHKTIQSSVLNSFLHRNAYNDKTNQHIKSIVNTQYVDCNKGIRTSHYFYYKNGKFAVDENKKKCRPFHLNFFTNKRIQLNHYFLKSQEDFQNKINRGLCAPCNKRQMKMFFDVDKTCNVYDEEILNYTK